jgi:hypothetical protein
MSLASGRHYRSDIHEKSGSDVVVVDIKASDRDPL